MLNIIFGVPLVSVLTALAAVVAEQLLAVIVNIISRKEIVLDVYTNLNFFLVGAAIIEESLKYFALSHIFRKIFNLRRFTFIFSAAIAGLFFGLTEVFLILAANGKEIGDLKIIGGETLFSLIVVILVHILTALLMGMLIASRDETARFRAPKTIALPIFIHLLVNFLIIQKGDFTNWLIGIVLGIVLLTNISILVFKLKKLD